MPKRFQLVIMARGISRVFLFVPVLTLLMFAANSRAEGRLNAKTRVTLIFTTLAYDGNIGRFGKEEGLRIGIISKSGNKASEIEGADTHRWVLEFSSKRIQGTAINKVLLIQSKGMDDLSRIVTNERLNALYICGQQGPMLEPIIELAAERKLMTMTSVEEYVKQGVGIGIVEHGSKPRLLLNYTTSTLVGAEWDPRILRLAKIVDKS